MLTPLTLICVCFTYGTCEAYLHNDTLEKKIFPILSKVAWTKKVPFGTITCAYTYTHSQA